MWWIDLDKLQCEMASLTSERHPSAAIDPSATIDERQGAVIIGARTKICGGATIIGPVRIGEDCLVGNLAMIRGPARIGDGIRIGFATEIKNVILDNDVAIGPQCFVADSVVGCRAYLGAQVRTSNHRLDRRTVSVMVHDLLIDTGRDKLGSHIGADASIGIQAIILPGRSVAAGSTIGPRVTVEKNLPTGRYRLAQQLVSY